MLKRLVVKRLVGKHLVRKLVVSVSNLKRLKLLFFPDGGARGDCLQFSLL